MSFNLPRSARPNPPFNRSSGPSPLGGSVNSDAPGQVDQTKADAADDAFTGKPGDFQGFKVPLTWSPMLTVWRKLHVEIDSMGSVAGNQINTAFTDIVGTGTALTEARGIDTIDDGSANLDREPPGNGRFENGTLTVGTVPSTITISPITANGNTKVTFPTSSIAGLPFSAIDNDSYGNGTMSGTITQVTKSGDNFVWTLNVTAQNENPIDWPDFVNGTLSVGGGSNVSVVAASAATSRLTTSALSIPCVIHDDDDDTLLPKSPDTSTLAAAFKPTYVVPVYDVGDNNMNVPFVRNVPEDSAATLTIQRWNSRPQNASGFWVAYLLAGFQGQLSRDRDPDTELRTLGDTVDPDGGSLIYLEIHQSHEGVGNPAAEEQDTVLHETGHAVARSPDEPVTDGSSTFNANYVNRIRSSPRPWP